MSRAFHDGKIDYFLARRNGVIARNDNVRGKGDHVPLYAVVDGNCPFECFSCGPTAATRRPSLNPEVQCAVVSILKRIVRRFVQNLLITRYDVRYFILRSI